MTLTLLALQINLFPRPKADIYIADPNITRVSGRVP